MTEQKGNLHWQIIQDINKGVDEGKTVSDLADSILSLILSEIDKAALTAEQILMATKYISDVDSIDIIDARLSAAAQLEAIKKQLRG
ncbi:MAG TPA: hypothetical protein VMR45_03200 [Patescibacteria group bacterium]|nr:hypothetical protein [Patescibacteria group bacterium]